MQGISNYSLLTNICEIRILCSLDLRKDSHDPALGLDGSLFSEAYGNKESRWFNHPWSRCRRKTAWRQAF
jgi:hypothetical protein